MVSVEASGIIKGLLQADRRSIARAISIVDNNENESRTIIKAIFGRTGNAMTVGFTGSVSYTHLTLPTNREV